jgi:hypothetical protein
MPRCAGCTWARDFLWAKSGIGTLFSRPFGTWISRLTLTQHCVLGYFRASLWDLSGFGLSNAAFRSGLFSGVPLGLSWIEGFTSFGTSFNLARLDLAPVLGAGVFRASLRDLSAFWRTLTEHFVLGYFRTSLRDLGLPAYPYPALGAGLISDVPAGLGLVAGITGQRPGYFDACSGVLDIKPEGPSGRFLFNS